MCHKHIIIFIILLHSECASAYTASVHFIIIPIFLLLCTVGGGTAPPDDDYNVSRRTADKVFFYATFSCHIHTSTCCTMFSVPTHTHNDADGNVIKSFVCVCVRESMTLALSVSFFRFSTRKLIGREIRSENFGHFSYVSSMHSRYC